MELPLVALPRVALGARGAVAVRFKKQIKKKEKKENNEWKR